MAYRRWSLRLPTVVARLALAALFCQACGSIARVTPSPVPGWLQVEATVPDLPFQSLAVAGLRNGFAALGWTEAVRDPCMGYVDGFLMTSEDGEQWTTNDVPAFEDARLAHIVEGPGGIYVIAEVTGATGIYGPCEPQPAYPGINVWRSTDAAQSWDRLPQSDVLRGAVVGGLAAVGDNLIAFGLATKETPNDALSVWTSNDGIEWVTAETSPSEIAGWTWVTNGEVIALAGANPAPSLWYSDDNGRNWHDATASLDPDIDDWVMVARDGRFVAIGEVSTDSGFSASVFTSEDGRIWAAHPGLPFGTSHIYAALALPDGYLALGSTSTLEPDGRRTQAAWASADGIGWRPTVALPETTFGPMASAAGGSSGVVVEWAPPNGMMWFAPLNTFEQPRQ